MKLAFVGLLVMIPVSAWGQRTAGRPRITGIDHVAFFTTSPAQNEHFWESVLGLATAPPLEPRQTTRFLIGSQWVGYSSAPDPKATNRLDHVALRTDDCGGLRAYLAAHGVKVPGSVNVGKEGSSFLVEDPEGNAIEFVEGAGTLGVKMTAAGTPETTAKPDPVSRRIIHAGFIVRNRTAEDHFYRDILGFHLYWQGGMATGRTDWVAMQVPDGTDWLEYMLNVEPDADLRLTGVANHVSLGVKDIKAAQAKLESHGWEARGREHAQLGKDGKWQLNLYNPDLTRIELMEFHPVEKPCCSDFRGPHPDE